MEMTARTTEPDGKSSKPLLGRIALVTGGSRGLGAAIAKELADAGATTIVNYHHTGDLATHVLEEIEAAGGKAFAEQCNVADYDEVERMFSRIKEEKSGYQATASSANSKRFCKSPLRFTGSTTLTLLPSPMMSLNFRDTARDFTINKPRPFSCIGSTGRSHGW